MDKYDLAMKIEETRVNCCISIREKVKDDDFENARFDERTMDDIYGIFLETGLIPNGESLDIVKSKVTHRKEDVTYDEVWTFIDDVTQRIKDFHDIDFDVVYMRRED